MTVQQPSPNLPRARWEGVFTSAPGTRTALIASASYGLHRVTPITGGVRKSVASWTAGPKFQ